MIDTKMNCAASIFACKFAEIELFFHLQKFHGISNSFLWNVCISTGYLIRFALKCNAHTHRCQLGASMHSNFIVMHFKSITNRFSSHLKSDWTSLFGQLSSIYGGELNRRFKCRIFRNRRVLAQLIRKQWTHFAKQLWDSHAEK